MPAPSLPRVDQRRLERVRLHVGVGAGLVEGGGRADYGWALDSAIDQIFMSWSKYLPHILWSPTDVQYQAPTILSRPLQAVTQLYSHIFKTDLIHHLSWKEKIWFTCSEILPSTLRLKVLLLSPAALDAIQVYLPVSAMWAFLISRKRPLDINWCPSSSGKGCPSFNHVISGMGFPFFEKATDIGKY